MKIALITLSCALNYGAVLQTIGMSEYLRSKGNDVIVINYIPERYDYFSSDYVDKVYKNKSKAIFIYFRKIIWKKRVLKKRKSEKNIFFGFLSANVYLTREYRSERDFNKWPIDADIFISGSDQIWNPQYLWSGFADLPFYLAFVSDNKRKISYASSFGKKNLSVQEFNEAKKLLSSYDELSVREETGKKILEKMGFTSTVVADPTLICCKEYWKRLCNNVKTYQQPYFLIFYIGNNRCVKKVCKKIVKSMNIGLKIIYPSLDNKKHSYSFLNTEHIVLPSVYEWIAYIRDAKYIITNSFHATVFSILFKKNFISDLTVNNSGRIKELLERVKLIDRGISTLGEDEIRRKIDADINWDETEKYLDGFIMMSREWIDNVIE